MSSSQQTYQNVVVMRHGDRRDYLDPSWAATAGDRKWDPPLAEPGLTRAFLTGQKLRDNLGFPIHRVFVSPFYRCLQTAAQAIAALTHQNHASNLKVSVEYGLCEMLNTEAIKPEMAPKAGKFVFNISDCEAILPSGMVDHTVEKLYQTLPQWEETVAGANDRYVQVFKALADKYPSENLLLVTHGAGVSISVSAFMKNTTVHDVEYCGFSHLKRTLSLGKDGAFTAGNFEAFLPEGETGIHYSKASS